ncbi:MAG: tRNA lysidine(34) synthetase TilS [Gammaproteobacteria bacterium]|nr:tRNA lysidine(34) synthetase TilS [Gammaproteobacteria bacterium]
MAAASHEHGRALPPSGPAAADRDGPGIGLLEAVRAALPRSGRIWVAYSGGMDSHVLLDAAVRALSPDSSPAPPGLVLQAAHVHHGIHPDADRWVAHCRQVCRELAVPLRVLHADVAPPRGESLEAWARRQRYRLLAALPGADDAVLVAHHGNDQAETVLLQLFRGAGPSGLAGMPERRRLGHGWLLRPLLRRPRRELRDYALRYRLSWVEDSSNRDPRLPRNYLRRDVLPRLRAHWPAVAGTLGRAARHQAAAARLLAELAQGDLHVCRDARDGSLDADRIRALAPERAANLLRAWLRGEGAPMPSQRLLGQLFTAVLAARRDRCPCLRWGGVELRRYRERLYLLRPLPSASGLALEWTPQGPLSLPLGSLQASRTRGPGGLSLECAARLTVRFRTGGETLSDGPGTPTRTLKKLLQERGVFPWLRRFAPLLYRDGRLVQIPGIWQAGDCRALPPDGGWDIRWHTPVPVAALSPPPSDAAEPPPPVP